MRFDGKVVLVTGAAGGFGSRMAEVFSDLGAKLVLSDLDSEGLRDVTESVNGDAVALAGDVTDPSYHHELVDLAQTEFGALDVAVNNAGIVQPMQRLPDTDPAFAQKVIDVDLMGVFYAMQAQLPAMSARFDEEGTPSAIVNIASAAGLVGSPFLAIYAAAKHGVVGLTRSAAAEYGRKGVRVNAVCPSFANTTMLTGYLDASPKGREAAEMALTRAIPMARVGQVDEVVQTILFAAWAENSFMTGETLSVDGGLAAV
ncbi:MAG: NAD(P)-dependent dehydrogenase (short-subunit alcohol dehydrogenase family) [Paracoccaceae bacterium]|jgi:NAD(P)-dependent dehydrogenase (short-subunit alcohol dehydrogenase family)